MSISAFIERAEAEALRASRNAHSDQTRYCFLMATQCNPFLEELIRLHLAHPVHLQGWMLHLQSGSSDYAQQLVYARSIQQSLYPYLATTIIERN